MTDTRNASLSLADMSNNDRKRAVESGDELIIAVCAQCAAFESITDAFMPCVGAGAGSSSYSVLEFLAVRRSGLSFDRITADRSTFLKKQYYGAAP